MLFQILTYATYFFLLEMTYCVTMLFLSKEPSKMFGEPKITDVFTKNKEEDFTEEQKSQFKQVMIIVAITIVPVVEETICHILLYPFLPNIVVSILFLLAHVQYFKPSFDVYTSTLACVCFFTVRNLIGLHDSLFLKIVLHALQNAVSGVVAYKICPTLTKAINDINDISD